MVAIEYSEDLEQLGLTSEDAQLLESMVSDEALALAENLKCFRRLLASFTAPAVDVYCKLNEYYDRQQMPDSRIQRVLKHLMQARFTIIEALTLI